eukprot:TRINITY_DN18490_c0_g1::TRINITY_DN18490_c0_g1_i1::g.2780::m.2780 TRINITY_DN18490_c0_g1::TRINITY_DN18490_c0_g1_i1::g.2780  ORF type:complete len:594 (+),score=204.47,sp/P97872/FMO5_MOUSE/30.27/4e-66,FMO-like/PF00743.14/1.1e-76,Pyr_redox_3/PF13738.1/1.7e-14,K_oxygenase/PF13434.1/8.1,K_oxygenase/PF13434.1/3.1e-11,K_oxygenase/PF13434.1/6.6e+02,NAD_binding_8/PF13450.1/0.00011,Shikimate_DH/PF01488.15/2.4,Shikimate_DH/PF01488.15/1.2,Shikimate_DH/PF01488.15/7.3e+03,Pyr_redox_2/PF07992.9/0.00083,NAD_bindi
MAQIVEKIVEVTSSPAVKDVMNKLAENVTLPRAAAALALYTAFGIVNDERKAANLRAIDAKPGLKKKVGIIGAGASGLLVMKELLEEGHEFICYEMFENLGGVFFYNEGKGGVYDSTMLTISNFHMAFSDLPPRGEVPHHWMRQEYESYLHRYAKLHDLAKYVQFKTEVVLMEREPGSSRWVLETVCNGVHHREVFDAIAVCTGTHQIENWPKFPGQDTFTGKIEHTSSYKNNERFRDKHVVMVGAGESGADIVKEISDVAATAVLSLRRPPFVIPRFPLKGCWPNDYYTTRNYHYGHHMMTEVVRQIYFRCVVPYVEECPKVRKIIDLALRSGGPEACQFLTKNENFVSSLVSGKCIERPGILRLHKNRVFFLDGTWIHADIVMCCTGYIDSFPFLKDVKINNVREMYKHGYHPALGENVVFVGWVRPATGGIPICSEMHARLFALICSGKRSLPADWRARIKPESEREERQFYLSHRIKTLVQYGNYMESMAEMIGCKPHMRKLFFTNPYLWFKLWFGPHWSYQYRLRGPHAKPEIVKPVFYHDSKIVFPLWMTVLNACFNLVSATAGTFGILPSAW